MCVCVCLCYSSRFHRRWNSETQRIDWKEFLCRRTCCSFNSLILLSASRLYISSNVSNGESLRKRSHYSALINKWIRSLYHAQRSRWTASLWRRTFTYLLWKWHPVLLTFNWRTNTKHFIYNETTCICLFKGTVHPKLKIRSTSSRVLTSLPRPGPARPLPSPNSPL